MKCESCGSSHYSLAEFHKCITCGEEICVSCQVVTIERAFGINHNIHYCETCAPEVYTYPEGFHDYSKGELVDNDTIKRWLNDCRIGLIRNPHEDFHWSGSGNTVVIGLRTDEDECTFIVTKNYKEITVDNEELVRVEF
jgi:hypothetical protein